MTEPDCLDYGMYSLTTGNPYVRRELHIAREDDHCLLMQFPDYPSPTEIEAYVKQTIDDGRTTAFLLSGREGTGRRTLTRIIVHYYVMHQKDPGEFVLVPYEKPSHDSEMRMFNVLKTICAEIYRTGKWNDHKTDLMGIVGEGDGGELDELDLQIRAVSLMHLARRVTPRIHLGLLIKGIQDASFMDALAATFHGIPMVVVAMRDHYETAVTASITGLHERPRWQRWAQHFQLPELKGPGVSQLAENRWTAAAPEVNNPFDLPGLTATFDPRPQPIGKALDWLEWLLKTRLRKYAGTQRWPAATELALPAEWIEEKVRDAYSAPRD